MYKDCVGILESNALRGLSLLLEGNASIWCKGVKRDIIVWSDAIAALRDEYSKRLSENAVYRELFSTEQRDDESTELFVSQARALLAHIPDKLPEKVTLDMVYGLLNRRIRKRLTRAEVDTFGDLLKRVREVEQAMIEVRKKSTRVNMGVGVEKTADNSKVDTMFKGSCRRCKQFVHRQADCPVSDKVEEEKSEVTVKSNLHCYGCGEPGYIRAKCPRCNKGRDAKTENSSPVLQLLAKRNNVNQRTLLPVIVEGRSGLCLADTGAEVSIAGYKVYELLKANNRKFTKSVMDLTFANGRQQTEEEINDRIRYFAESQG